jgi:hypothetical protein
MSSPLKIDDIAYIFYGKAEQAGNMTCEEAF